MMCRESCMSKWLTVVAQRLAGAILRISGDLGGQDNKHHARLYAHQNICASDAKVQLN
jgi:hypothetical protein